MEVILDELTPVEFFGHGGIVKVTIIDDEFVKECNLKKKYTFFDHKSYIRFFRNLYMTYIHNHQEENSYDLYKYVNNCIKLNPSIGNSEYTVDLDYDHIRSYETAKFYFYNDKRETEIAPRDPYGIKNVCFSLVDENDSRWDKYCKQRLERGFDDSETWSLDGTIARFIYPRLKVFLEDTKEIQCHPADITFDEWIKIIEDMVKGFELLANDDVKTDDENIIVERALDLFREYFHALWT